MSGIRRFVPLPHWKSRAADVAANTSTSNTHGCRRVRRIDRPSRHGSKNLGATLGVVNRHSQHQGGRWQKLFPDNDASHGAPPCARSFTREPNTISISGRASRTFRNSAMSSRGVARSHPNNGIRGALSSAARIPRRTASALPPFLPHSSNVARPSLRRKCHAALHVLSVLPSSTNSNSAPAARETRKSETAGGGLRCNTGRRSRPPGFRCRISCVMVLKCAPAPIGRSRFPPRSMDRHGHSHLRIGSAAWRLPFRKEVVASPGTRWTLRRTDYLKLADAPYLFRLVSLNRGLDAKNRYTEANSGR